MTTAGRRGGASGPATIRSTASPNASLWRATSTATCSSSTPSTCSSEKSFEIDDDGNAWWILPGAASVTIGLFGGETVIQRAVLVNAGDGRVPKTMAVEDVPQWVDRVYPSEPHHPAVQLAVASTPMAG